jgi:mono/diheme cytochrome c family protein
MSDASCLNGTVAPVRRLAPLAVLAVFLVSGCGSAEVVAPTPNTVVGTVPAQTTETVPPQYANGNPVAGKVVFTSKGCTACHTLKDAGATGTVGPNLDVAKPALGLAVDRVVNGKGAMPSFKSQLTTQQIADVTAYVVKASRQG